MANSKEAITIVLDVGNSMHTDQNCSSIIKEAKKCIYKIIQGKIFSESKDEIALILFGNPVLEEGKIDYTDIEIVQDLQPANWKLLDYIKKIKTTSVSTDFIRANALLSAINLLQNATSKKKFTSRRILFISNFDSFFPNEKVDEICENMKKYNIGLNIIGSNALSINDPYLYQDTRQDKPKVENALSKLLREVKGESFSFNDVLHALTYYQIKEKQSATWNANLELEMPEESKSLNIPISAYIKISERKPKPWKTAYESEIRTYSHEPQPTIYSHKPQPEKYSCESVPKIERRTTSLLNDELQTVVPKEELIAAYRFGTSLVPFSEEDKTNMSYESGEKGIKILAFTKNVNVQHYLYTDNKTMYVLPRKSDKCAGPRLAAFSQALHDTKMVAIVRYVNTNRSSPKIGFLSPKIKENCQHLIFVALPFLDDLHHLVFPSLDLKSKNIPTDEQLDAVDQLINAMDMTVPVDNESNEELLKPNSTPNLYIQRIFQCLEFRTLHPHKPLPEIAPHIEALLKPSTELLSRAEEPMKRIECLFPIKKSGSRKILHKFSHRKSKESLKEELSNNNSAATKNFSETDLVDAVIDKITEVGSINPVRDFQYLVSHKVLPFDDICDQLMNVIYKYLEEAKEFIYLRMYHSKIISACKEFRHTSLKESNCDKYNIFMEKLKNLLLEYGNDLWNKIKSEKIGLISVQELPSSKVSLQQAMLFLTSDSVNKDDYFAVDIKEEWDDDDDYDLLDQL